MLSHLSFYNDPAFFGFRVNRETARIGEARVYDPQLKEYVGHNLLWAVSGSNDLVSPCELPSGSQGQLYIFAKDRYADEFFVYHSRSLADEPPRSPARYTEKKKRFGLMLRDSIGRTYKYKLIVRNTDQSVGVSVPPGLRGRVRRLLRHI